MNESLMDSYFYSLVRVIDDIYQDEDLGDVLHFIVSLAATLTGGKGCTLRVLEQGTFDLKLVSSYGLSHEYLACGAIDRGRSVAEILQGDIIIVNDFDKDPRVQNCEAAHREGIRAVIGIPFTVNDTTYSILRVYYPQKKVPSHEEMELLSSLGRLSCLAIERAAISRLRQEQKEWEEW